MTISDVRILDLRCDDLEPLQRWALDRPATTVVRSFRPDIIAAPGYRTIGDPSRQDAPGSILVNEGQLLRLQTVRPDYPIAPVSKTKRYSIIGAFLPPLWAKAILHPLLQSGATYDA